MGGCSSEVVEQLLRLVVPFPAPAVTVEVSFSKVLNPKQLPGCYMLWDGLNTKVKVHCMSEGFFYVCVM